MIAPTPSMRAGAEMLLADPSRWTSARRKSDGRRFWIVRGRSGTYYCDATACTRHAPRSPGVGSGLFFVREGAVWTMASSGFVG